MLKDSVFSPSFGNRPSYLVGRDDVLHRFEQGLRSASGNRDRAMVLSGQRGSGGNRCDAFLFRQPFLHSGKTMMHSLE